MARTGFMRIAAWALAFGAFALAAAADEADIARFKKANERLAADIEAAEKADTQPPMLSDPATAQEVRDAYDERFIDSLTMESLPAANEAIAIAVKAYGKYATFKIQNANLASLSITDAARMRQNYARFEGEIAMASAFFLNCGARIIEEGQKYLKNVPQDRREAGREGALMMRQGLTKMLRGAVLLQAELTGRPGRLLVLDAVIKHLEIYAAALDPESRKAVIETIDLVLVTAKFDDDIKDKLLQIRNAMARTDCTDFCAL